MMPADASAVAANEPASPPPADPNPLPPETNAAHFYMFVHKAMDAMASPPPFEAAKLEDPSWNEMSGTKAKLAFQLGLTFARFHPNVILKGTRRPSVEGLGNEMESENQKRSGDRRQM